MMATPIQLPSGPMSSSWVRGTRNGWAIERLEEARHGLRINAGAVVRNPCGQGDIHGYHDSLAKLAAARRTVARRELELREALRDGDYDEGDTAAMKDEIQRLATACAIFRRKGNNAARCLPGIRKERPCGLPRPAAVTPCRPEAMAHAGCSKPPARQAGYARIQQNWLRWPWPRGERRAHGCAPSWIGWRACRTGRQAKKCTIRLPEGLPVKD